MIGVITSLSAAREVFVQGSNGQLYVGHFEDCVGFSPFIGISVVFETLRGTNNIVTKSIKIPSDLIKIKNPRKYDYSDSSKVFENSKKSNSLIGINSKDIKKNQSNGGWRFLNSVIYMWILWSMVVILDSISGGLGFFALLVAIPLTLLEIAKVIIKILFAIDEFTGK